MHGAIVKATKTRERAVGLYARGAASESSVSPRSVGFGGNSTTRLVPSARQPRRS